MKKILAILVGVVLLCMCAGIAASVSNQNETTATRGDVVSATPEPAPPFETIRAKMDGMTEAQFKQYARSLKGKEVHWSGWVEDVNETLFGTYEVWVDMDAPDEMFSVQDVTFDVPADTALQLRRDQKIRFTGIIDSAHNVLESTQITLSDVTIQP